MSVPAACACAVLLAVVGAVLSGLVAIAAVAIGLPPRAAVVLAVVTASLTALLGVLLLARRWAERAGHDVALLLLGPLLLTGLLVGPSDASLAGRAAIAVAVLGAALLGLRSGSAVDDDLPVR